jgi:hypothetical protein
MKKQRHQESIEKFNDRSRSQSSKPQVTKVRRHQDQSACIQVSEIFFLRVIRFSLYTNRRINHSIRTSFISQFDLKQSLIIRIKLP